MYIFYEEFLNKKITHTSKHSYNKLVKLVFSGHAARVYTDLIEHSPRDYIDQINPS